MTYKFTVARNYEDYASGRFFYNQPGQPAFPVRLSSEIFQRCLRHWQPCNPGKKAVVYDPCCGSAYHLSVLAYLHWGNIDTIIASDVSEDVLKTAARNLRLLTSEGVNIRIRELELLKKSFGKLSHVEALQSAHILQKQLSSHLQSHLMRTQLFQANVFNPAEIQQNLEGTHADVLFSDIPYGSHSQWQRLSNSHATPMELFLTACLPVLHAGSVVAIAADKKQKIRHPSYQRLEQFKVGKRQIALLSPIID